MIESKKSEKNNSIEEKGFISEMTYLFPNIINIEVFRGACPCKCQHCPIGLTENENRFRRFGKQDMDLSLYKKVVDEVELHPSTTLRLHSVGETIMWKNIAEGVRYAKQKNVITWLFTSLVTRDTILLETLCENVSIIEVSINSTSEEDYFFTKGCNEFRQVKANIEYMAEYIKKNELGTRLIVSRVQTEDVKKDNEFEIFWKNKEIINDAFVRSYHTYNDLLLDTRNLVPSIYEPCLVHWMRFNIAIDGKAVVCFNELFKEKLSDEMIYGDLKENTISEIWHNKKFEYLRDIELNHNYNNACFSNDFPCRECKSRKSYKNAEVTSEAQVNQLLRSEEAY